MTTPSQHDMSAGDNTWERALDAVRSTLHVPSALSTLIRGSWNESISSRDFMRLLGFPGCNSSCLLRAAEIVPVATVANSKEVQHAVEILGVRASAVMLSINFVCQSVLDSAPPEKVWAPLLKDMMSEVEIGYHFGMSVDKLGCEYGMLVGFSHWAGLAILLGRHPREFTEWRSKNMETPSTAAALRSFGCEGYQASSLVLQQLGFGTDVATAAVIALGDLQAGMIELKPDVELWRAARHWIGALHNGRHYPDNELFQKTFANLMPPVMNELNQGETPLHLAMLYENINRIRTARSSWTWHLPSDSYEKSARIVAENGRNRSYKTARPSTSLSQR